MKSGPCVCCGRTARGGIRVDSGLIHMDCYVEHHCGPDVPWPSDHRCGVGSDTSPAEPHARIADTAEQEEA